MNIRIACFHEKLQLNEIYERTFAAAARARGSGSRQGKKMIISYFTHIYIYIYIYVSPENLFTTALSDRYTYLPL